MAPPRLRSRSRDRVSVGYATLVGSGSRATSATRSSGVSRILRRASVAVAEPARSCWRARPLPGRLDRDGDAARPARAQGFASGGPYALVECGVRQLVLSLEDGLLPDLRGDDAREQGRRREHEDGDADEQPAGHDEVPVASRTEPSTTGPTAASAYPREASVRPARTTRRAGGGVDRQGERDRKKMPSRIQRDHGR